MLYVHTVRAVPLRYFALHHEARFNKGKHVIYDQQKLELDNAYDAMEDADRRRVVRLAKACARQRPRLTLRLVSGHSGAKGAYVSKQSLGSGDQLFLKLAR
jgi:hypothetical protein